MTEYTREEIYAKLVKWFDIGVFTTTGKVGLTANDIEKLSNSKELSYTPHTKILFVGNSEVSGDYSDFCLLFEEKRLLTPLQAKVKKNARTLYDLKKMVQGGLLMRFEYKGAIIYID